MCASTNCSGKMECIHKLNIHKGAVHLSACPNHRPAVVGLQRTPPGTRIDDAAISVALCRSPTRFFIRAAFAHYNNSLEFIINFSL